MFDDIKVRPNKLGIPEGEYQTQDLGFEYRVFEITEDGVLVISPEENRPVRGDDLEAIQNLTYSNPGIDIYTDTEGGWFEYRIAIEKNKIVSVVNTVKPE